MNYENTKSRKIVYALANSLPLVQFLCWEFKERIGEQDLMQDFNSFPICSNCLIFVQSEVQYHRIIHSKAYELHGTVAWLLV